MLKTGPVSTHRLARIAAFALLALFVGGCTAIPFVSWTAKGPKANLAVVAQPSTSFESGNERLDVLRDGEAEDGGWRDVFGVWRQTEPHWVQYEWDRSVALDATEVYWWSRDDRRMTVTPPEDYEILYWDGSDFVPVPNAVGLGSEPGVFNRTTFDEVHTTRIRLQFGEEREEDDAYTFGVVEWKVFDSGDSPDFPPVVQAGVDRVVVTGGRTYLTPSMKSIVSETPTVLTWSKASGPGKVTFEDAHTSYTNARFDQPGEYLLRFTARRGGLQDSATLRVKAVAPPPPNPLQPVPTSFYTIDNPLWDDRAKALVASWIPYCMDKVSDPELESGGLNNWINAAKAIRGEEYGEHQGLVFADTAGLNTFEAMCIALMVDPEGDPDMIEAQESMRKTIDEWLPLILNAQEPDGYFQTAWTLRDPERWRARWAPETRRNHEGYVAGYFIEAALAHHMMTRGTDDRFLDAALKLADLWVDNIGPAPKKTWYNGHQELEQALIRLGEYVNALEGEGEGEKYFKLAKYLLDARRDGSEYDQSHLPVIQQYEAVGHAVRATYSYSGMAGVAMETGNVDYQSAVFSIWDNIINRKYYVTGGIGSGESSEGFGPDYSLRHNAYCESCSSSGVIFFLHKMNMMTHDSRHADLYEETIYNALLGSIDLAGENFYYQNPLDSRNARYAWHVCPCCVGNIPRTLLALPTWTYVKGDDALFVNLFIGSTILVPDVVGDMDVEMKQITDYPLDGNVEIVVEPERAAEFAVHVRVPDRSVSEIYWNEPEASGVESFRLNGEPVEPVVRNGYAVFERRWEPGDKIELVLPMKVQRVRAIDKVEATRGQVALRYGPLVYNVERVDQDIDGILEPDAPLKAVWRPDFLGGMLVVEGEWADGSPLLAVPNYARQNREIVEDEDASRFGGPGTEGSGEEETEADRAARRRRSIESSVWIRESPDAP